MKITRGKRTFTLTFKELCAAGQEYLQLCREEDVTGEIDQNPDFGIRDEQLNTIIKLAAENIGPNLGKNDAYWEAYWNTVDQTIEDANERVCDQHKEGT